MIRALWMMVIAASGLAGAATADPPLNSSDPLKGTDVGGQLHWLGKRAGRKATALVFLHPECPISNQYVVELNRIAKECPAPAVEFFGVISDVRMTRKQAAEFVASYEVKFPILFDASSELALRLQPKRVPEAFVLDREGAVLYRGRIDDQWASIGKRRSVVSSRDLRAAVAAVAKGEKPAAAIAETVGCVFEGAPRGKPVWPTYARDVAPILQNNCQGCHRPGEVAPFSLAGYDEAAKRAKTIHEATAGRVMPPWKAAAGVGHFQGERRLSRRELQVLADWAAAGAPIGNPDDLPPAPTFVEGWRLGEPDLVLKMSEPYRIAADGPDVFRYFVIPIPIPEDKSVVAFEFRPGNKRVCHHAILYVDSSGAAQKLDAADPEPGYRGFGGPGFRPSNIIGFWAPGYSPSFLPEGVGRTVRASSVLAMQMHYHPSGKEEFDQSTVGLYFAKKPTTRDATDFVMGSIRVDIAPGEKNHRIASTMTLPAELDLIAITPHMHLIGKQMKLTATPPNGRATPILWVDDWSFNWQEQYRLVEPIHLPTGTRIDLEAVYDNSADNPANPSSPPKRMRLGEQSTDEMCLCVLHSVTQKGSLQGRLIRQAAGEQFRKEVTPELIANLSPEMRSGIFRMLIGDRLSPGARKDALRPGGVPKKSE